MSWICPPRVPESCDFGAKTCKNSVENAGEARAKCIFCKLSPDQDSAITTSSWLPLPEYKRLKHPVLESEKRVKARATQVERQKERLSKDRGKKKILRKATKAEKTTEHNFIKATKNSGRSNRDGDHKLAGCITLDTKLQTTRIEPIVRIAELEKVVKDAANAGNEFGALVLRTKNDYGVVVMKEQDFAKLVERL